MDQPQSSEVDRTPLLEARDLSKTYPGTVALQNVSFDLFPLYGYNLANGFVASSGDRNKHFEPLLSKKRSKKELTKGPPYLVKSLV